MHEDINLRRQQREKLRQERLARQRKLKLSLMAAAVVVAFCAALIYFLTRQNPSGNPEDTTPPDSTGALDTTGPQDTAQDQADTTVIHLAAAGDLCVTDKTVSAGGPEDDFTAVFMDVLPLLADADLTMLNLEGTLNGAPYGTQTASAPQQMAQALAAAGVDIVQTANSRSVTGGLKGLNATLNSLRAAGLEPLGTYGSAGEFRESDGYIIREVNGIRIAFVAFTKGMDGLGLPAGSEDCVNLLYEDYTSTYQDIDKDKIRQILRAAAEQLPDLTVAMLHWGSEYNDIISGSQADVLKLLRGEGVDVVLGTHSHLLQTLELDEENGSFVAYSLGDFLSDGDRAGTNYSVVLDLEITKNHLTGETSVTGYTYTPIFNQITDTGMRLLRIEDAIAAYESNNLDRVSEEDYNDMVSAMERIEKRVTPEEKE